MNIPLSLETDPLNRAGGPTMLATVPESEAEVKTLYVWRWSIVFNYQLTLTTHFIMCRSDV